MRLMARRRVPLSSSDFPVPGVKPPPLPLLPPPVPELPPPEPPPGTQTPSVHVNPAPHGVHWAPLAPQLAADCPSWHTPLESQHPMQLAGLQPDGGWGLGQAEKSSKT